MLGLYALFTTALKLEGFVGFLRASAIGHEILTEDDKGPSGDGAREGLGDGHLADVGVDGAVEGEVFGEGIDEHQRVVDMGADDRLFGASLGEAQPSLRGGLELAREDRFREKPAKEAAHVALEGTL